MRSCYGVAGPVVNGPDLFRGLTCSFMLHSEWIGQTEGSASFRIGPSIAHRCVDYVAADNANFEWYRHPDGARVDGFPRFMRIAYLYAVQKST